MRRAFKELKTENATLRTHTTKKSRSSKTGPVPDKLLKHMKAIEALGRMFSVMGAPWVDPSSFKIPRPTNLLPYGPERYSSDASDEQGIVAELFYLVPATFHEMMTSTAWFGETVSTLSTRSLL